MRIVREPKINKRVIPTSSALIGRICGVSSFTTEVLTIVSDFVVAYNMGRDD